MYFIGSLIVGTESYAFGFLITNSIKGGLYCLAFMESVLVLYVMESIRTAKRK